MTSRRLFFKMMCEDIQHRLWAAALVILGWFFIFPVRVAMIPGGYQMEDESDRLKLIIERTEHWFTIANGWVVFVIILGAIVLGISSFSYLHSKKKVDFYHSIPIRREELFLVHFWDGVWIMAVPYAVSMICAAAVGASFGVSFSVLMGLAAKAWLFHMIYFLILYSITVIAMMMTGNLYLGFLGMIVFYFYMPSIGALVESLYSGFFKTYAGQELWAWKLMKCSPVTAYMEAVGNVEAMDVIHLPVGNMLMVFFVAMILMGIGIFLYQKRPSEAAGKAMAFPISRTPIKILLVIPISLYSMLFFYALRDSMPWAVFGLICGCVVSHGLIEILYHFDFRKLFAHPVHMAACFIAATLLFLNFSQDWMGYDRYLPNASQVESSYLDSYYGVNWVNYGAYEYDEMEKQIRWETEYEYSRDHMYLTDTQKVMELARTGIEYMELDNEERVSLGENATSCMVTYRMKSGKNVSRRYIIPIEKSHYIEIQDSLEYKRGVYPVLEQKPEEISAMYVKFGEGMEGKQNVGTEQIASLLEAYQKDLVTLTVQQQKTEDPIGVLYYIPIKNMSLDDVLTNTEMLEKKIDEVFFEDIEKNEQYYQNSYPIYASFTNTLEACKAAGIKREDEEKVPYTLCEVRVYRYDEEGGEKFQEQTEDMTLREGVVRSLDEDRNEVVYSYTNKEEIRELLNVAVPNEYADLNDWREYTGEYSVAFTTGDVVRTRRTHQMIREDIPDFLKSDLLLP